MRHKEQEGAAQGQDVVCSKCEFPIRDGFCGLSCDGKADGKVVSFVGAEPRFTVDEATGLTRMENFAEVFKCQPPICACGTTMVCPDIGCDLNKSPRERTER